MSDRIKDGEMLFAKGQLDEARAVFEEVLAEEPSRIEALNNLGVIAVQQGDFATAKKYVTRALELQPDFLPALGNLAVVHKHEQNWQGVIDCLEPAMAQDASNPSILNLLGLAYLRAERLAEAAEVLNRSLTIQPNQPTIRETLETVCELESSDEERVTFDALAQRDGAQQAPVAATPVRFQGGKWREETDADAPEPPTCDEHAVNELTRERPNPALAELADQRNAPQDPQPLNILFVQEVTCIRNYKEAVALRARGHRVSLAYTKSKLSDVYPSLSDDVYDEVFHITSLPQLWVIAPRFDVVHCHNEPDALSVAALAGGVPVVHDTHDLISLRHAGDSGLAFMEAVANRGAQGRVYCTPYLRAEAEKLYAPQGPSITLCNYASLGDVPETLLPKLSATDGETHAVYEGGVGGTDHRDFGEFFCNLAAAGVHVHVYPTFNAAQLRDIFARHHRVHIHQTASPKDIIREMSQYDFGLIPFNVAKGNQRFLDTAMPNKLFEYLAAGLPVATSKLHSFEDWFSTHPVGVTFESVNHLLAQLPKLRELAGEVDFSRQVFTYEQQIDELVGLYRKLIAEVRQPGGEPVSISTPQPSGPRGDKPRKTAVFISGPPRYVTYLVDQLDEVLAEVDCDYFFHMWKDDLGNKVRNEQCEGWQELWRHPRTKVFLLQAPYAEGDFERRSWRASGRVAACGMPASSINATVGMFSSVHTLCNALESLPDFEDYTHVMRLRTDTLILADDFASKLSPDPTVITAAASKRIAPGRLCDHFMFAPVDLFFACWKHDAETVYRVYESVNYSPEQTLAELQKRYAPSATLQHAIKRFEDYHIVYNPTRSDDPAWINRIIETCGVQDLYENLDKHLGRQRPTRAAS